MLWRIVAAVGGAGGLGSLLLPYAYVTGGALGIDLQEGTYTLFELARAVEDAGSDPAAIYGLAVAIVVGSTLALVGAVVHHYLAGAGGLVQGGSAAAYWYGIQTEGSQTYLAGLGQMDATVEVGFYVLAGAAVVSIAALVVGALSQ
jgi:hypothetical protein